MPTGVEQVVRRLSAHDQAGGFLYPAQLGYDPGDPYAVILTLGPDPDGGVVRWVFARDLLVQGLRGNTGFGDVRIACCGGPWVHVQLTGVVDGDPVSRSETVLLRRSAVAEFLAASYRAVPAGAERVDVDAAVARLLEVG